MGRRRTFRNDKEGVKFLDIWQDAGRRDAKFLIERSGKIPADKRFRAGNPAWSNRAYLDGFNAELRRQRIQRSGITIGVFADA